MSDYTFVTRRIISAWMTCQIGLLLLSTLTLSFTTGLSLDPARHQYNFEEMDDLYSPKRYEFEMGYAPYPNEEEVTKDNAPGFKNPFVFKRQSPYKRKDGKVKQKHFYRSPFILKRKEDNFAEETPREMFKNPFVLREEMDTARRSNLFPMPSVFRRMVDMKNAEQLDSDY